MHGKSGGSQGTVITIRYATTRREIWNWYWKSWAKARGLWWYHVAIAANVFLIVFIFDSQHPDVLRTAVTAGLISLPIVMLVMSLIPQLFFKPGVRKLGMDEQGIYAEMKGRPVLKSWREVRSITAHEDVILVESTNGHALIVPARAFSSPQERETLLEQITRWHSQVPPQ